MFEVGKSYKRKDLHKLYGGQRQGGISTPKQWPIVFLFTGKSGSDFGYEDSWQDGMFLYTGEGQSGDMKFRMGNKAIRDHAKNGRALYLFEQERKGHVRFVGEFSLCSFQYRDGKDKQNAPRRVIVFHMKPVATQSEDDLDSYRDTNQNSTSPTLIDIETLRRRAYVAASEVPQSDTKEGKRRYFERKAGVRNYVLARSKGFCEACKQPAPFLRRNGTPYLEPHHIHLISESGPDHPRWVAAICPNCHRSIHHGRDGKDLNDKLKHSLKTLEGSIT